MFASRITREMINNLKGRVSKVLNLARKLSEEEKISLEGIYTTIDNIILWDKKLTKNKATRFKKTLKGYASVLEPSSKVYIQKHIVPMIDSIVEQEWVKEHE